MHYVASQTISLSKFIPFRNPNVRYQLLCIIFATPINVTKFVLNMMSIYKWFQKKSDEVRLATVRFIRIEYINY